jgi:Cu-Zn family superoxide dismutase
MGTTRAPTGAAAPRRTCKPSARIAVVAALAAAALLAACGDSGLRIVPESGPMAVASLQPRNNSTVRGTIAFTQRGNRVWITANFVELWPGPHSLYIHAVGNCSSPNAASAGPVWNIAGAPPGKRTGDLPQINAGTEGYGLLQTTSAELSVGTGKPNDVIGHAVVLHADLDPDPKPEFGVRNGWLACGVIERSEGLDLKQLL